MFKFIIVVLILLCESNLLFAAGNNANVDEYRFSYVKYSTKTTSLGDNIEVKENAVSKINFKSMLNKLKEHTSNYKTHVQPGPTKTSFIKVNIEYTVNLNKFLNSEDIAKIYSNVAMRKEFYCNPIEKKCGTVATFNNSVSKSGEIEAFRKIDIRVSLNTDFIEQIFKTGDIKPWIMRFEADQDQSLDQAVKKFNKVNSNFNDTGYYLLVDSGAGSMPVFVSSEQDVINIYKK
jgi:hypothetical protein